MMLKGLSKKKLKKIFNNKKFSNTQYSVNIQERRALQEPSNMNEVILPQADRGGADIILDEEVYRVQHRLMLLDTNTYRKLL